MKRAKIPPVDPGQVPAPDRTVWWVNQGQTLPEEMAQGYVSTGVLDSSGRTPWHWETVARMSPGDVTIHVAQRGIRAIGRVVGAPAPTPVLASTPVASGSPGPGPARAVVVPVRYFPLTRPILVGTLPEPAKVQPPFNRRGNLQQITCCEYPHEAAALLAERYRDRWPEGSPFAEAAPGLSEPPGEGSGR
jgi:hypothetical protein